MPSIQSLIEIQSHLSCILAKALVTTTALKVMVIGHCMNKNVA